MAYMRGEKNMVELYQMMFKRKSFRRFKVEAAISELELERIVNFIDHTAERLSEDIPISYKIVPITQTSCKRGEYGILIYSNTDSRSLLNIGFMFSQLDFFLASIDIGACWYGMGKPNETVEHGNLPYVIMIAIGKATTAEFRKDHTKAKRKSNDELSLGEPFSSLLDYVKYSPSACNSQPWILERNQEKLSILLNSKEKMIIPKEKIIFYNTIDLGIMIFSCELWLRKNQIGYKRSINESPGSFISGDTVAEFYIKENALTGACDESF